MLPSSGWRYVLVAASFGAALAAHSAQAATADPFGVGVANSVPPPGLTSFTLFNATPAGGGTSGNVSSGADWTSVTTTSDSKDLGSTYLSVAPSLFGNYRTGYLYNQDGSAVSATVTFTATPVSGEFEVLADNGGQLGGTTVTVTSDGNSGSQSWQPEGAVNDWYLFSINNLSPNDTLTVTVTTTGGGTPELGGVGYSHCYPPCFPTPEPPPLAPLALGALALLGIHGRRRARTA
jgi:hypothetical protein